MYIVSQLRLFDELKLSRFNSKHLGFKYEQTSYQFTVETFFKFINVQILIT